jgi:hypothetical protein
VVCSESLSLTLVPTYLDTSQTQSWFLSHQGPSEMRLLLSGVISGITIKIHVHPLYMWIYIKRKNSYSSYWAKESMHLFF